MEICDEISGVLAGSCDLHGRPLFGRQMNLKDRPFTRLTFDFDPPAVILDDPLTDGES
jgi:hypothetical protein